MTSPLFSLPDGVMTLSPELSKVGGLEVLGMEAVFLLFCLFLGSDFLILCFFLRSGLLGFSFF